MTTESKKLQTTIGETGELDWTLSGVVCDALLAHEQREVMRVVYGRLLNIAGALILQERAKKAASLHDIANLLEPFLED